MSSEGKSPSFSGGMLCNVSHINVCLRAFRCVLVSLFFILTCCSDRINHNECWGFLNRTRAAFNCCFVSLWLLPIYFVHTDITVQALFHKFSYIIESFLSLKSIHQLSKVHSAYTLAMLLTSLIFCTLLILFRSVKSASYSFVSLEA